MPSPSDSTTTPPSDQPNPSGSTTPPPSDTTGSPPPK
jgi:hypothetical protein